MTKVMVVFDAETPQDLRGKVDLGEVGEADLVIGLNAEGTAGVIHKDRHGLPGTEVKVV
jgi:hypothetical protein